jgi:hypothetical protein
MNLNSFNMESLQSRCPVCGDTFPAIMREGKLVDAFDGSRHQKNSDGRYVHARCVKEVK